MQADKKANNRFQGAAFDDSDDEPVKVNTTKTQKKKEERKITESTYKPVKINASKMAEGGFEVTEKDRAPAARGGRGGARGGERGGARGGARGGDRGGDRGGARGGDRGGDRAEGGENQTPKE